MSGRESNRLEGCTTGLDGRPSSHQSSCCPRVFNKCEEILLACSNAPVQWPSFERFLCSNQFYFIHLGGAEVAGRWWEEGKERGLFGWQAAIPVALCARFINAESGKQRVNGARRTWMSHQAPSTRCNPLLLLPGGLLLPLTHFYFYNFCIYSSLKILSLANLLALIINMCLVVPLPVRALCNSRSDTSTATHQL
jgi:hypothetical protein